VSQAYLKFYQGLDAEVFLEDSWNPIENIWWDLKNAVAASKPKAIAALEAIAHEE